MVSPASEPVQNAIQYLANLEEHIGYEGSSARLEAEFEGLNTDYVPVKQMIERYVSVLNKAVEKALDDPDETPPQVSKEEIKNAANMINKFIQEPKVTNTEDLQPLLHSAQKVLSLAQKHLIAGEGKTKVKSLRSKVYNQGIQLLTSSAALVSNRGKAWDAFQRVGNLLGPHRPLSKEMGERLYNKLLEDPKFCKDFSNFVGGAEKMRAYNFKMLEDPEFLTFMEHDEIRKPYIDLYEKVFVPVIEDHDLSTLMIDIFETGAPQNDQLLTDSPRVNLLDLDLDEALNVIDPANPLQSFKDFLGTTVLPTIDTRTMSGRYFIPAGENAKKRLDYLEKTVKNNEEPDPAVLDKIKKEYRYIDRNTQNLKQKINWEEKNYNDEGGLISAVRFVGFMTETGHKKVMRVKLDFSGLGAKVNKLTQSQSIVMVDLLEKLNDSNKLLPWLHAVHAHPNHSPFSVVDTESMKDPKGFQKDFNRVIEHIGKMNWLNVAEKDNLVHICVNFIFDTQREFTKALLTVGHE